MTDFNEINVYYVCIAISILHICTKVHKLPHHKKNRCVTFAINEQGGEDSEKSDSLLQAIRGIAPRTPVPSAARNRAGVFHSIEA